MNGIWLPGSLTFAFIGLGLLALLLFAAASRWGRWSLWTAGYLAVLVAVGIVIFAGQAAAPGPPDSTVPAEPAPAEGDARSS